MSKINSHKNILYVTTCLSTICLANIVNALPDSPDVQAGNVNFNQTENELHITQQTEKAVINWQGFDINNGELTQFHQPSSSSIALNRVISQNPTKIDGALKANGNIIIINQNGVLFGKGALVDVNGLIASTVDIDNDKFMKSTGKLEFNKPGNIDAKIINEGKITAQDAGLIGLVAPQVINDGVIIANGGTITLSSGETFTIDMYGDKIIEVAVSDTLKKQLIENNDLIQADGGKIVLTAAAGKEIVDSLISIKGTLKANSVKEVNGEIIIFAEGNTAVKGNIAENKGIKKGNSRVEVSGTINSSGTNPGERGGKITVAGDDITLKNGSLIVASGYDGKSNTTEGKEKFSPRDGSAGGEILIGGNYLGKGSTPTANNLTVEDTAVIINDAINSGDAGRSILWSDNKTNFHGTIFSRAFGGKKTKINSLDPETGGNSGNGGFVETSGHKNLNSTGFSVLTASNGDRGTHLLDPDNITIYGNFSPDYESTDSSINLADKLKIHLDASAASSVTLQYLDSAQTATDSGMGTVYVADGSSFKVGMQIRLSPSSLSDTADVFNADTYTILDISGNELTLSSMPSGVHGAPIYVGYVSSWADSAGTAENATNSDTSQMPLWLVNTLNGNPVINFDGTSDNLRANLSFMNDNTWGYNGKAHTNFYIAKTTTYGRLYSTSTSGGDTYEGFLPGSQSSSRLTEYTMDYALGGDYLSSFINSGSINPSSAFSTDAFNTITYQWLPDSGSDRTNTRTVYANTNLELTSSPAGTIGPYNSPSTIGGKSGSFWGGQMAEIMMYNANLDTDTINLLNQYTSAKWDQALVPPGESGLGSTEALKAMASVYRGSDDADGYSSFTTDYLKRLSQSADIYLTAGSNITLDLKGDTLTLNDNANFSLTAGGNISSSSTGTIKTKRTASGGNIDINAEGNLDLSKISMKAQDGGTISLAAGSGRSLSFNANTFSNSSPSMTIGSGGGSARNVSISGITADNKTYDTTTSGTFSGTASASNANVGGTLTSIFANKNVGSNISVYPNGVSLTLNGENGLYSYTTPAYTANITKANLSLNGLNADKTYDTTRTATITGTATVTPLGSDSVSITGTPIGSFADRSAALSKPVTVTGLTIGGDDAGNYQLDSTFSANIYRKLLNINGLNADKTYDATTAATITGTLVIEPFSGDSVTAPEITHRIFLNKNAGTNRNVFIGFLDLSGADSANYQLSSIFPANIAPASLTIHGLSATKVYDGTTTATITGTPTITPLGSDSVSITGTALGSFADKNAGTRKTVTLTGLNLTGTDSSNYVIEDLFANITPAPLHVNIDNIKVTFPISAKSFTYTYSGLVGGDTSAHFRGKLGRDTGNSVGSYNITEGDLTALENYEIKTFTLGKFTISPPTSSNLSSIIPSSSTLLNSFLFSSMDRSLTGNALSLVDSLGQMSSSESGEAINSLMPTSNSTPPSTNSLIDLNNIASERIDIKETAKNTG